MFPRNSKYPLNTTCTDTRHNNLSSATSSWNHPQKKQHFVDGEREKEIVELTKQLKERECRLFKHRARDRKRANEHHTSDTSAQREVRLGKRRVQQRDAYASFSVERRHARIESVSKAQYIKCNYKNVLEQERKTFF